MEKPQYLRIVFGLDALVNDLERTLDARLAQPEVQGAALTDLLEQRLAVLKMRDQVKLVMYSDFQGLPPQPSSDFASLEKEFEHSRSGDTILRRTDESGNFWHEIERAEHDIRSIIRPLEIVGKWPPDMSQLQVVGPWPPDKANP